jgi:hypothetical protein
MSETIRRLVEYEEDCLYNNPIEPDLKKEGWELIGTGGGCTAAIKRVGRASLLLTDQAEAPLSLDQECTLGVYDEDEKVVMTFTVTARQALELGRTASW